MRRIIFRLALLLGILAAGGPLALPASAQGQSPVTFYVVTAGYADLWATGQSVVVTTNVYSQTSATPTGTVQFSANGQPLGPPAPVTEVVPGLGRATGGGPILIPGNYTLTATYSGDANFASGTGADALPILVEANPPTYLPVVAPSSLTFAAGATTGNSFVVTIEELNNCLCSGQWSVTLAPRPGTPTPGAPATLVPLTATGDVGTDANGNNFNTYSIDSTAAYTVTLITRTDTSPGPVPRAPIPAAAALFLLIPLTRRRVSRALLVAVASLVLLPGLIGCGVPASPATSSATSTTETVPGSSGQYYVTVSGETFDGPGAYGTYFLVQIPVTIQ